MKIHRILISSIAILAHHYLTAQPDTEAAEKLFDLQFNQQEREMMKKGLEDNLEAYKALHAHSIDNKIPPALVFHPLPQTLEIRAVQKSINWPLREDVQIPDNLEEIAFYSIADLSVLIKSRKITSTTLTRIYLDRIKKYGDTLQCVITLTEELALKQAKRADKDINEGNYRCPLHGIPYGIKDLFAVKGYKTTWGATPFKNQIIDEDATIVKKLEEAGAVLVAKLSLGALAWGDVWFDGHTKNPWDLSNGSSGSSAGSASATSAGLVAFAIGTETLGSIISPSNRCGVTGLRPTFGRVSRTGGMNLSWSMDKVGPICRSALDCALVFDAIRGPDGLDVAVNDVAFNFEENSTLEHLRIGYLKDLFDASTNQVNDSISLRILMDLGADLKPVTLPDELPADAFGIILSSEAAAAFDELTRSNRDTMMVRQIERAWPNVFRQSRFVPAVAYINANRVRYQLIQEMYELFSDFDAIVTPSFGGNQLQITNLTGHPAVVLPNGFSSNDTPTSFTILGNLYDEATMLAIAHLFQNVTDFDDKRPPLFLPR